MWPPDATGDNHMGRYLDAATVTLGSLCAQQEENAREALDRAERARIYWQWHDGPFDDLLDVLERATFPAVVAQGAARFILDEIYYPRAAGLSQHQIDRLTPWLHRRHGSSSIRSARLRLRWNVGWQ
jgi:hypothetical protein